MPLIRLATPADADAFANIYGPFCTNSIVSFELTAPTPQEMLERIRKTTTKFPWLVLDDAGTAVGYAYASAHRERLAYQWAVDVSAYIGEGYRRRGVGRALYTALFAILRAQGFYKAYAGIALPNPNSEGLHTAMGFEPVGVYKGVGYKMGGWQDVGWYQMALQPEQLEPKAPLLLTEVLDTPGWQAAIAAGLPFYRGT